MATQILPSFTSATIKETSVDFGKHTYIVPVELAQYDDSEDGTLVCIKVNLFKDGEKYYAPDDVTVNLKYGSYGGYFAYYKALGFLEDRSTVIIPVRLQITLIYGDWYPSVELVAEDGSTVASAPFHMHVSKSPFTTGSWSTAIRSDEAFADIKRYHELQEMIEEAVSGITETDRKLRADMIEVMDYILTESKVLILSANNVTSLPLTIRNEAITANMVCIESTFTNQSALATNWHVDSYDGYVVVSGSLVGSTDVILYMLGARTSGARPIHIGDGQVYDIDIKADKPDSPIENNIPLLDMDGNLLDSGFSKEIIPSDASASNKLVSKNDLDTMRVLLLSKTNVTSLPITITDNRITSDMTCVNATYSNKNAILSRVSVTTSDGSAVLNGLISGATDITIQLMHSM